MSEELPTSNIVLIKELVRSMGQCVGWLVVDDSCWCDRWLMVDSSISSLLSVPACVVRFVRYLESPIRCLLLVLCLAWLHRKGFFTWECSLSKHWCECSLLACLPSALLDSNNVHSSITRHLALKHTTAVIGTVTCQAEECCLIW